MASMSYPHLPIYILLRILSLKKPPFWNVTLMKIGDVDHSTSYIASRFLKYFFCLWKQKSSTFRKDHFDKLDHTGHYYVELSRFTNNFAYICSPICTKFALNWLLSAFCTIQDNTIILWWHIFAPYMQYKLCQNAT